jgi:hypothetical protein
MIQYSLLGRPAASIRLNTFEYQFCLRMGTELVPETLYSNELTRLCAREDYIEVLLVLINMHGVNNIKYIFVKIISS